MKLTNRLEWNKVSGGVKTAIGNGSVLALFDGPDLSGLRIRDCGPQSLLKLQLTELPLFEAFVTTHPAANVLDHSMFRKLAPGMESLYLTELSQLRMTDCLDSRYPMLIRTMALHIPRLSMRVVPAQGASLFYYEHIGTAYAPVSCLMLLIPGDRESGTEEMRLYLYLLGKTEWDEAHRILRFFEPGGTMVAASGDPNRLLRRVLALGREENLPELFMGTPSTQMETADVKRWGKIFRRSPLCRRKLNNGTEERILRVVYETFAALYSRRTPEGLYAVNDRLFRTTVQEQYHAMLFLYSAGYVQEAEEVFRAVVEYEDRTGSIVRELSLREGAGRGTSGYCLYDTALTLLRMICLGAELKRDGSLAEECARIAERCCDCLCDGIAERSVPYSGHEPELAGLPFDARFNGSACATMAFIACIRRLFALSRDGRLPLGDRLKYTSDLAEEMDRAFCSGFVSGSEILADKKLKRSRKTRYVYGICRYCRSLNREPYEGWLLPFRTGSYICPECLKRKDELRGIRKQPSAARRNVMPLLYAALWNISALPEEEMLLKLNELSDSSGELSAEENALLLHCLGGKDTDAVSICLRNLALRTEREQWQENSLGSRLFSAAMLAEHLGGQRLPL